jgi:nitrogen regulatory protein P-II 1
MKKVETLIRPESIEDVRELLGEFHTSNFTLSNVLTNASREKCQQLYRGHAYTAEFDQEVKIEAVVRDDEANEIVHELLKVIGRSGPGKRRIVLMPVSEVIFEAEEYSFAPPPSPSPQPPREAVQVKAAPTTTVAAAHPRLWNQVSAMLARISGWLLTPAQNRANESIPLAG